MNELEHKIKLLAKSTKLDNRMIAEHVGCSERSARRYAGDWKKRVHANIRPGDFTGQDRKAFIFFDPHVPYHNPKVYDIAMQYAQDWGPDDVIIGGDFVDFKDVSNWKDDPRRMGFKQEVDVARGMLGDLRDSFPHAKIYYLEGNHEHRLARYTWMKSPELCDLPELAVPQMLRLDSFDIEYVSNVERMNNDILPFKLGKLFVLHGHEVNLSSGTVNLARTCYLKTHCNVIFGHHHQSQHFIFKKLDNTHEGAWAVGGLCKLSESYQPTTNWINGFCTLKFNPITGYFKVRNKLIINGQIL